MGIDSTIALGIKPVAAPTYNPLATLGQFANTSNALIGAQANQLAISKSQALQSAYQNTPLNPVTGLPDTNALIENLRNTAGGGLAIPDVIAATQKQQENQYTLQKAGLDQATSRSAILGSALAPLMAQGNTIQPTDVYRVVQRLHAAGVPTDGMVQQIAATMPTSGGAPLSQWVKQVYGQNVPAADQASIFNPKVATQDTGGQVQTYDQNIITNPNADSMTFNKTLTPGEQVAPQTGMTPSGVGYTQTTAARAVQAGLGNLVSGQGQSSGQGSLFGTGRILLPGGSAPAGGAGGGSSGDFGAAAGDVAGSSPGVGGPASPTGIPAGGMQTGMAPAATAAATAAGTGSANDLHDMYAQANIAPSQLYQLQKAQSSLQTAGVTGPGTETTQAIASFLNSQVPFGLGKYLPGVNPNQIESYDEAHKYLQQYASNVAGATGSDSRLATALSSNASTSISNLAAQDVVKATIGLVKMGQAKAAAWTATGQTPDQYDQFNTNWSQTADPRAYIFDQLSPDQRTNVLNSIPSNQKSGFLDQVWSAGQAGLLDPSKLYAQPAATGQTNPTTAPGSAPAAAPAPAAPPAAVAPPSTSGGTLPPMVPTGY